LAFEIRVRVRLRLFRVVMIPLCLWCCCRYGLLGKRFKDTFGVTPVPLLSGLVGMKEPNNHGVPYAMTEEFTSVYRMHPLLPDKIDIKDIKASGGSLHTPPTVEE
jgi:alpha-dioxygenase